MRENRPFSEIVHEETIKPSQRDCAKPRLQRPGNLPAGRRRKRQIIMETAMRALNQLL